MRAHRALAIALAAACAAFGCNAVFGISKGEVAPDAGGSPDGGTGGTAGQAGSGGSAGTAGDDAGDQDAGHPVDDEMITVSPGGTVFSFSIEQPNGAGIATVKAQLNYSFEIDTYEVSVRRYRLWESKGFPRPTCAQGDCDLESVPSGIRWHALWNTELNDNPDLECYGPSQEYGFDNQDVYDDDFHPMVCLTWYQAMALCISEGKRLPTETEWMYVATNAGDTTRLRFPWGTSDLDCESAVHDSLGDNTYCGFPTVIGSTTAGVSAHGLYDLSGSVFEWVWDEHDVYPETLSPDYTGPNQAMATPPRIRKGGGYITTSTEGYLNNWSRRAFDPGEPHNDTGFRCARTVQ